MWVTELSPYFNKCLALTLNYGYVAFGKWWNAKLANGEAKSNHLFAEPFVKMKVELVEDVDIAERLIADEDELLMGVSRRMKQTEIDKTLNRIFQRHIEFETGR